ncbi:carbonic anhydrase 2 [Onthophagus taurus]|uniref:carbonic anhydrase 2 n=1 Tax=Onthophagus taurus TaxID=166361 RepID=UPI000C1FE016|nr:carbonic anhydrase 2 [Onthophagus taurus]
MSNWGYSSSNGPETWAESYPTAAGPRQSPVDIKAVNFEVMKKLDWKYNPKNTIDICNTGYGWKVHVDGKGSELIGGPLQGKYILEQYHCHWGATSEKGSEHTVDGISYAAELHFVHWNAEKYQSFEEAAQQPDGLCVLGVFLKSGRQHDEVEKIVSYLSNIEYKSEHKKINEAIDPNQMLPQNSSYWTYLGSLTTPPCSECVIWIVFKEPIEVSEKQLEAFRSLKSYCCEEGCPCDDFSGFVKTNFRPTLPLGQRQIKECPNC